MSIWGKVSGGAAGLLVGGPVGAVLGAVAGHFLFDRQADPGVVFTMAIIALAAKMARAGGNPGEEEFAIFRRVFGWTVLFLAAMCVLVVLQSTAVLSWMVPG